MAGQGVMAKILCCIILIWTKSRFVCSEEFQNEVIDAAEYAYFHYDGKITYSLSERFGSIRSTAYHSCMAGNKTSFWSSERKNATIILKFTQFYLPNCTEAKLFVTAGNGQGKSYCENRKPRVLHFAQNIRLKYLTRGEHCNIGFAFNYLFPELIVEMKSVAKAGQYISIQVGVPNLPTEINTFCSRKVETKPILRFSLKTSPHERIERFSESGVYNYEMKCKLKFQKEDIAEFKLHRTIEVQDVLQNARFKVVESFCGTPGKSGNITVQGYFVFPVTFHITVGHEKHIIVENYVQDWMRDRNAQRMTFEVPKSLTALLGAGIHSGNLIAENHVSAVNVNFDFYLCEKIKSMNILPLKYIDLSPANFIVSIKITRGSPAIVRVSLRDRRDREYAQDAASVTKTCRNTQECSQVTVQMSVPFKGKFDIVAVAANGFGTIVSSIGPVESFPLVHDLYLTSFPIDTTWPGKFVVLYKIAPEREGHLIQNPRKFVMQFSRDDMVFLRQTVTKHKMFKDFENSMSGLKIPFDPSSYCVCIMHQSFLKPGKQELAVTVMTENRKQSMTAKTEFMVKGSLITYCFAGVDIRDGQPEGNIKRSFKGRGPILLSARVGIKTGCEIPQHYAVEYEWKIFEAKSLSDTPNFSKEVQLPNMITNTDELYIQAWTMKPGLYVAKVKVTLKVEWNGQTLQEVIDFASVEVPALKLQAMICNGSRREIGLETYEVEFDASCSENKNLTGVKFIWFCAASKHDLPSNKYAGKFQRRGSCFGWKPSFVGEATKIQLNLNDVKARGTFFVRVFISLDGYDDEIDDQEIVLLPFPAPQMTIECRMNCGKYLDPTKSMILFAKCDSCVYYNWSMETGMLDCESERCKIPWKIFRGGLIQINITGFDDAFRNVTISYGKEVVHVPSKECKLLPGHKITKRTPVTLDCQQEEPGFISFYLRSDHINSLIQYGYSQNLSNFCLPEGYVTLEAKICSLEGYCRVDQHFVHVTGTNDTANMTMMQARTASVMKAGNSQEVVRNVIETLINGGISYKMKEKLLTEALGRKISSPESARTCLDILRISLDNSTNLIISKKYELISKLTEMKRIFRSEADSSTQMSLLSFDSLFMELVTKVAETLIKSCKI